MPPQQFYGPQRPPAPPPPFNNAYFPGWRPTYPPPHPQYGPPVVRPLPSPPSPALARGATSLKCDCITPQLASRTNHRCACRGVLAKAPLAAWTMQSAPPLGQRDNNHWVLPSNDSILGASAQNAFVPPRGGPLGPAPGPPQMGAGRGAPPAPPPQQYFDQARISMDARMARHLHATSKSAFASLPPSAERPCAAMYVALLTV